MPRNMSFSLTTQQIRDRTKTVTRRLGWKNIKIGERLNACVKCMGLRPGETIERIALIEVVGVLQEPLWTLIRDKDYGKREAAKEGFPQLSGDEFVAMFCEHMRPLFGVATEVTRIQFRFIDEKESGGLWPAKKT